MQFILFAAGIIQALLVFMLASMPAEAVILNPQTGIQVFYAMDTYVNQNRCSSGFTGLPNCEITKSEFQSHVYGATYCSQICDFETNSPATVSSNNLSTSGTLTINYPGIGVQATITTTPGPFPLGVYTGVYNNVTGYYSTCPSCPQPPYYCLSTYKHLNLPLRSNSFAISFQPAVGALSFIASQLNDARVLYIRLTYSDSTQSSLINIVQTAATVTLDDAGFLGIISSNSNKLISRLQFFQDQSFTPICFGIDELFVATADQVSDEPGGGGDEYGIPVARIAMTNPFIYCNGADLDVDGSSSFIDDCTEPCENSISSYSWMVSDLNDDTVLDTGPIQTPTTTLSNLSDGVYKLNLTVMDEYQITDSTEIGIAVGTCPESGGGESLFIPVPISRKATVPNLIGKTQSEAEAALHNAKLAVGVISEEASETLPSGSVTRHYPLSGTIVPKDSPVMLVVSTGPAE